LSFFICLTTGDFNADNSSEFCSLIPDTGICRAYLKRWAFIKSDGKCKEFVYGGCNGNSNRFITQEECLKVCGNKSSIFSNNSKVFKNSLVF
jgi:hypothetical protein